MKRFNNTGCIRHLKGNRRKPFQAVVTIDYNKQTKKQKLKSLGTFETFVEAEKALFNYFNSPGESNIILIDLINIFIKFKNKRLSENTIKNYLNLFKKIKKLNNKDIKDISLNDLQTIIDTLSPCYQNNLKNLIVELFDFAIKNDYITDNKAKFIEVSKYDPNMKKVFSSDELLTIFNQEASFFKILKILLYTGMRINELLDLKIVDINLKERVLRINRSKTKNGIRIIPIHEEIIDILIDYSNNNSVYLLEKNNKKIEYMNFYKQFKRRFKNHTIHETRHTFITKCKECEIDLHIIKLLIGHASKDITLDTYTHIDINVIKKEFKKLKY